MRTALTLAFLISAAAYTTDAQSCSLQKDVDFAGNDIANVAATAASDCCTKCSAQSGCRAFTWTDYNGGTCWLKSQKGAPVAKAGALSAEVVSSPSTGSCALEMGVDYVSNDVASASAAAATDCCALCSQQSGCGAFTWTNWNGGTCWLKSGKGETKALAGAYSAVVSRGTAPTTTPAPVSRTCPNVEKDTDFTGTDIGNFPGASATDCCAKCSQQTNCGAFTWTNWNGGTCWLKRERGGGKAVAGSVSAVVTSATTPAATTPAATTPNPTTLSPTTTTPAPVTAAPLPSTCSVVDQDTDYYGLNIGDLPGSNPNDCCAKCSAVPGCGAFTWTDSNGGTCWLKNQKGSTATRPGAQSAQLAPSASTSCALETDVDYVGNDIASTPAGAASACCVKCRQRSGCGAFTWTSANGGTCYLKGGKGGTKALAGAFSAVVKAPTQASGWSCPNVEKDTDYTGDTIGSLPGAGASDCCALCGQQSGCTAFTWANWNGGTCYLKRARGASKAAPGVVSGVLTNIPMPVTTTPPTTTPASTTPSPTTSTGNASHVQTRLRAGEIPLRSVNLGGWLVAERWMSENSSAWIDVDGYNGEYVTMQQLGKEKGTRQFEQHRQTWITEADIAEIAAAGLNTVRVPVGFWIVNDDPAYPPTEISQVYAPGSLKYLDTLINDWAVKYNLAVMLSLHAHLGSQNGYDHSAPQVFGSITWSTSQANVDNSLQFATFLAARYQHSVAFLGMNLMNEPMSPTDMTVVQAYYTEAYKRIRATGNDCILVTSPALWYQYPPTMMDFMHSGDYSHVWHEFHVYFRWTHEGKTEQQILETAKPYRQWVIDPWFGNLLYLGEWSLAGPDSAPFQDKELLRQYAAIQLTNYEAAKAGWAFWSWRHDEEAFKISGWSLRQLLRLGIFTIPRV